MKENWESNYIKKIYTAVNPKRPKGGSLKLIALGLVVLLVFFAAFLGFSLAIFSKLMLFETLLTLMPGDKFLGETNILVLGIDDAGYTNRSDTVMVAHIDPSNNSAGLISIPRDTRIAIPGRGEDKINHAHAYGGPDLTRRTIEKFLGVKIPYYVTINITGLEKIIDEIGGVEIDVEKRMYYVDYSQNLFVDLHQGRQRLSGNKALSYLRYRSDGGDLHRIARQQKFLSALAAQLATKENIINSPSIVLKLVSCMNTNLSTKQIIGLAINMRKIMDFGQIKMTSVSGYDEMINGVYYMRPNYEAVKADVEQYLKSPKRSASLEAH